MELKDITLKNYLSNSIDYDINSTLFYALYNYFYDFRTIMNLTSGKIQDLFENGKIIYNYSKFNNYDWGIILYNNIINRLTSELNITSNNNRVIKFKHQINTDEHWFMIYLEYKPYSYNESMYPPYNDGSYMERNRVTGRSTRLADTFISDMLYNPKDIVLIKDHISDELDYCRYAGRRFSNSFNIKSYDRELFNKIRKRLEREAPEFILMLFKFNKLDNTISFDDTLINKKYILYKYFD